MCRSYRLVITSVKDSASANSVQLAKLDLFTQLDPPTQPTPSLLGSVCQLQEATSLAAEVGNGSSVLESVGALLCVLGNIVQHPAENKHRSLRMENARIKAMLSGHKEVSILLRAIGMLQNTAQVAKCHKCCQFTVHIVQLHALRPWPSVAGFCPDLILLKALSNMYACNSCCAL